MNWGCCYYITQCHSPCFPTTTEINPTLKTIELDNNLSLHQNNTDDDYVIEEIPVNRNTTSNLSKINLDLSEIKYERKLLLMIPDTSEQSSNYAEKLPQPITRTHYYHPNSLSQFPKEQLQNSLNIEQTTWYILCFLIEILAFAQIGYLIFEDLLPWISNLLIIHFGFSMKLKLNINCRLKRMFGTFFLLFEEWSLFIFGVERICSVLLHNHHHHHHHHGLLNRSSQPPPMLNEPTRWKPHTLCIKISTCLFIAIIFAALCNYLWVFGQFHWINSVDSQIGETYNISFIETFTCNVRSEYFKFYYTFLIYFDPLFSFLFPHLCAFVIFVIILLKICLKSISKRFKTPRKITQDDTLLHIIPSMYKFHRLNSMIDHLTTLIYLVDSFIIVTLKFWRNIEKSMMVFVHVTLDMNYLMIRNELYHLVFCLVPILTIIIYLMFYVKLRKYCNL
ncbi:unnamed protein product [Schistosoma turkestanicum]|nr:unnamed protein product [Schistosoma turkestanicum]